DDLETPPRTTRDLNPTTHETLRRRGFVRAVAAPNLMCDPQDSNQLMTFDRREQRAVGLIRDLTVWLLQSHDPTDSRPGRTSPGTIVGRNGCRSRLVPAASSCSPSG